MPGHVVTIGVFDGVHRGHQRILRRVIRRARARGMGSTVVTFVHHPQGVLGRLKRKPMITTIAQREAIFKAMGISRTVALSFTKKFSRMSPESFVRDFLQRKLRMRDLCVGYDFAFGKDRGGNVALLRALSRSMGFCFASVRPVRGAGRILKSTLVRERLAQGELPAATAMMGRPYSMRGRVTRGRRVGRKLGFPTANLRMDNDPILPDGVYAVWAGGAGGMRPGVLNVGRRPTFGKSAARSWELHLWGVSGNLYGRALEVYFHARLRPERKFPSAKALASQIARDVAEAKKVLNKPPATL